ncbi:MAG TPA: TrmH family RNA methyltransferase [Solirubrobacter sp.]|nr:TrmH family RNA methyltransferase [Solirubrobacter sp.]
MDDVVLDGFHALKHALRFGAEILTVTAGDPEHLEALAATLAPDLRGRFRELARAGAGDVRATARHPRYDLEAALRRPGPVVYLEAPRHLGNLGAAIRVAAAADAAAVLTSGPNDPWHPHAIRGSAGLHFALPVIKVDAPPRTARPLIAIDPDGEERGVPRDAVLAFGSERHGLTPELLARADARIRIPMRAGVSSLNLATSVAATLYGLTASP